MIRNNRPRYALTTLFNTITPLMEGSMSAGEWVALLARHDGFSFAIPLQQTPGIVWQWQDYPACDMRHIPDYGTVTAYITPDSTTKRAIRQAVIGYAQFALGLSGETIIYTFAATDVWHQMHLYTCSSAQAWAMLTPLRLFAPGRYVSGNAIVQSFPYIPIGAPDAK